MADGLREQVRVAAIYARVSSERQREQATVASQLATLRELAGERGLVVPGELVFCDEGFSGASLARPALERLRDRAAEGCFEVLLCHAPRPAGAPLRLPGAPARGAPARRRRGLLRDRR